MRINDLIQDIQTLTPTQQESVHSFVFLLKHPDYLRTISSESGLLNQCENIEPFSNERDALDFVNDYSGKIIHEAW